MYVEWRWILAADENNELKYSRWDQIIAVYHVCDSFSNSIGDMVFPMPLFPEVHDISLLRCQYGVQMWNAGQR